MQPTFSSHRHHRWMHACITAAVFVASGAQAQTLDLIETWRLAQSHDPQFATAQAQREQAVAKRQQIAPLWDAQTRATMAAGVGGQDAHITRARAMGQSGVDFDASVNIGALARVGVGTQKPISNPTLDVQSRMLDTSARIGEVQWTQAQQDMAWRAVQRYFEVLMARQTVEVLARQYETLGKAQQEIARRQAIGDATTMDVQEAKARLALVHAQVLQAQYELDAKSLAYRQLTGQAPQNLRDVNDKSVAMTQTTPALSQWLMQAQTQSTQLQLADLQVRLQEEEANRIRLSGTSPKLDWVGQAQLDRLTGYGMSGVATQQITGYMMGVQWSAPLGAQNLNQAREQEALKQADKLRRDQQWALSELESQVSQAWQALHSSQARLQAHAQAHVLSQQRLRTTRQAHQLGTRSTMEWLGAEQDAAQAELLWRLMRIQVVMAKARLWWSSGALGDTQMQEINQHLQ